MFKYLRSLFSWFFLDEKECLKGITVFVGRLAGCLHTSRITTNGVNTLTSVSFSARLRLSKSKTELAPVMPSVSRLDKVKGFQGFCFMSLKVFAKITKLFIIHNSFDSP